MFPSRCFQKVRSVLSVHRVTGVRSVSAAAPHRDKEVVQIENPYKQPPKGCLLCNITVDYRNIQLLSQFVSPHTGRIYGRHITGLCGLKQKEVTKAIKRAQSIGFMPVTHKHPQFLKDPNVCGIRHIE